MSSSKRRKLTTPPSNSQLSAFAVRHTLKNKPCDSSTDEHNSGFNSQSVKVQAKGSASIDLIDNSANVDGSLEPKNSISVAGRPSKLFSTFAPCDKNFKESKDGSKFLKIAPGDRLVIVGQYEICVHKGDINLLGATLRHLRRYRVFASPAHSLPVIRCSRESSDLAEISLHPFESGFEELKSLSPLFGSLWDNKSGSDDSRFDNLSPKKNQSTFQILYSSCEKHQKSYFHALVSPPEWNLAISSCIKSSETPPIIFVCGPKSAGKSTFAKLLVNRFLSRSIEKATSISVALLDLDPGQPEYSPPGQLSLTHVKEPNLGPSFSHPVCGRVNECLRSHFIGAISPTLDPEFYITCALSLFSDYRRFLYNNNSKCPLVINTPGWVLGTGLEILIELLENIRPNIVMYMSQEGPPEVVESLKDVDKSINFVSLPSQTSESSSRTAAQLRKMLYISYFHLNSCFKDTLSWNFQPISSFRPWEIRYSGDSPGILGIMCYGEVPSANLLAETLNGSLLSIVVIDEMTVIPGLEKEKGNNKKKMLEDSVHLHKFLESNIIRTPEDLPYFDPKIVTKLRPETSHSIGLALVRGIDISRRRLQVITPISAITLEKLQETEKPIVLVHGKLDTPGWAYTEYLTQRNVLGNNPDIYDESENFLHHDCHENETDTYIALDSGVHEEQSQNIPWIERLQGHQGRSAGSFVWRVRRDLGKLNDGSD
ncbi:Polynucleotide 5'-hydroxyl-kinase GRC3 [Erysiphe necator]|nr:Polynucleotide 5'-hydroxyl-kinase GRC3 [Erysiphe necator]